ncbi:MAG: VWD domain-containing protein [Crocinitomicaceae bacterium]|nr:VWD domain-containing protein [Crocinitomicaceae bacterium]MDP5010506.1 VWD domain-containing protein [Crocinitomicaceae bacterium]MDP5098727.1 VWD domain-containing protein [Crocinitomicaceae bacterium]
MKKIIPFLLFSAVLASNAQAQDRFKQDFEPVRKELTTWDPIRGEWLASSLEAISKNQPIPDRTFPEDFTPAEMLRIVPEGNRNRINEAVNYNGRIARDTANQREWGRVNNVLSQQNCRPVNGRTYGDPHLVSFDGASYSFQTVGEFVLAKSSTSNFEIQARQKARSDDFSLNTAVAMNVGGDRVSIYAEDYPDNFRNTPVRLNGSPIVVPQNSTYYLPNGGTIRSKGDDYQVNWPTGESVSVDIRSSGSPFLNLTVSVYPCLGNYSGLLGNANGRQNDDFDTGFGRAPAYMAFSSFGNSQMQQGSDIAEKEYLAFLAKDFARQFRITPMTSLFDYGFGQSTYAFTDESFPRVHRTLNDLPVAQRDAARKTCEGRGVTQDEMGGCIYDQAYLQIPPNPRPEVKDPTANYIAARLDKPVVNVNTPRPIQPSSQEIVKPSKGTIHPDVLNKPEETSPKKGIGSKASQPKPTQSETKEVEKPETSPIETKPSVESPKPAEAKPTPKPVEVKPAPKPIEVKPKPAVVKPTPLPTPAKPSPITKPGKG